MMGWLQHDSVRKRVKTWRKGGVLPCEKLMNAPGSWNWLWLECVASRHVLRTFCLLEVVVYCGHSEVFFRYSDFFIKSRIPTQAKILLVEFT